MSSSFYENDKISWTYCTPCIPHSMSVPYVQEDSLIFRELYKTIFLGHTVCIEIPLFPNGLKIEAHNCID